MWRGFLNLGVNCWCHTSGADGTKADAGRERRKQLELIPLDFPQCLELKYFTATDEKVVLKLDVGLVQQNNKKYIFEINMQQLNFQRCRGLYLEPIQFQH